jgi:hypothetical protein
VDSATTGAAHLQGTVCNTQTVCRALKIVALLLQGHLHCQVGGILADFFQSNPEVYGVTDRAFKALVGPIQPARGTAFAFFHGHITDSYRTGASMAVPNSFNRLI